MTRTPIKTFLDPDLARQVARVAAVQGRSESAVVADAVRSRFAEAGEYAQRAGEETMKRQLNRLEARFDKMLWEQAQAKECLLLFVRVWLEHNPPLPDEIEESAAASAAARFERFVDVVANSLMRGQLLGDLSGMLAPVNEAAGPAEAHP